jgi:hypothetical protein
VRQQLEVRKLVDFRAAVERSELAPPGLIVAAQGGQRAGLVLAAGRSGST